MPQNSNKFSSISFRCWIIGTATVLHDTITYWSGNWVPFATDASFDVVISFGVTQYLNSLIDVEKKFAEMVRVAKPGGRVVCCEVSDSAKEYIADAIRANPSPP